MALRGERVVEGAVDLS